MRSSLVAKVPTSTAKATLTRDQGKTFGKKELEKEKYMEKEKRCEMMKNKK